jgi:hypothetical protein
MATRLLPRMAAEYGGKIICQVKLSQGLRNSLQAVCSRHGDPE